MHNTYRNMWVHKGAYEEMLGGLDSPGYKDFREKWEHGDFITKEHGFTEVMALPHSKMTQKSFEITMALIQHQRQV